MYKMETDDPPLNPSSSPTTAIKNAINVYTQYASYTSRIAVNECLPDVNTKDNQDVIE